MATSGGFRAVCPRSPDHDYFVTSAHVAQKWKVDRYGGHHKTLNDCAQVTHDPDTDNLWECAECGAEAKFEWS